MLNKPYVKWTGGGMFYYCFMDLSTFMGIYMDRGDMFYNMFVSATAIVVVAAVVAVVVVTSLFLVLLLLL